MEAKCGCTEHDHFSVDGDQRLLKLSWNKVKKTVIAALVQRNYLNARLPTYLCVACSVYAEKNFCTENVTPPSGAQPPAKHRKLGNSEVQTLITLIKTGKLSSPELVDIVTAIGQSQQESVRKDAHALTCTGQYDELENYDPVEWLRARNDVVTGFLQSVSNVNPQTQCKKTLALATSVDCLYSAAYPHTVTPLSFSTGLRNYLSSGCKTSCNLTSQLIPSGSYSTVLKWLDKQSSIPNVCPAVGDVVTFLDNNQCIASNWRVRLDAKALLSVVTTIVHLSPGIQTNLQINASLSPANWFFSDDISHRKVTEEIRQMVSKCSQKFVPIRDTFIQSRITQVYSEQVESHSGIRDLVDDVWENPDTPICPGDTGCDEYATIPHAHAPSPCKVTVGDPVFENPCSYDAVEKVLLHIAEQTCVGKDRKWTIVGGDGSPYVLGCRLIEEQKHLQNILLLPGPGHYEINMVRACFKLLWEVGLVDLAKMLGFRSLKALTACQKAFDHHKSWQILKIFFFGTADEVILAYVRMCMSQQVVPDVSGFNSWVKNVKNPNVLFLIDSVFTYMLALFTFREGIRRNNSDHMLAGRTKFASLFYGLHMTTYQEIEYRDLKCRILAPAEVLTFINSNESFSVSGHPSKGEGGDFILEAKNRRTKMWLPPGIPKEHRWLRVYRNQERLEKIRNHMDGIFSVKHIDPSLYHADLRKETVHWRCRLRSSAYLSDPQQEKAHTTLGGVPLDAEFVSSLSFCLGNQDIYMDEAAKTGVPGKGCHLVPIFYSLPTDVNIWMLLIKPRHSWLPESCRQLRRLEARGWKIRPTNTNSNGTRR